MTRLRDGVIIALALGCFSCAPQTTNYPDAEVGHRPSPTTGDHVVKIRDAIRSRATFPAGTPPTAEVVYDVEVLPGGEVLSIKRVSGTGHEAYEQAVLAAIRKAEPLPVPADYETFRKFRTLRLRFRAAPIELPMLQIRSEPASGVAAQATSSMLQGSSGQSRPRRKFVATSMEPRFASYVEKSLSRILDVVNNNYPAYLMGVYGDAVIGVAVRSDGTIENVAIHRSSGNTSLDQGAAQAVSMAGPFDPFPEEIRKDTDVLHIIRTFYFTKADDTPAARE